MINIGYENCVKKDLVAVILEPSGSHAKKLRKDAAEKGQILNASSGHKVRSIIVLTTGQIVLSALQVTTLKSRLKKSNTANKQSEWDADKPF